MENQNILSEEDVKIVVNILSKLKPGFLPFPIFHEIARLTAVPILEVVPLRKTENGIEILLLQRDQDDPVWPGQLHTPGTVIRATDCDTNFKEAFNRIFDNELTDVQASEPVFVNNTIHHSGRSTEISQIYWTEVTGESKVGKFYDVDNLPTELIQTQLDFIPAAIEHFKQTLIKVK